MSLKAKIILSIVVAVVLLNIFLPDRAEEVIEMISESTGISEEKIQQGVDIASDITKDTAEAVKESAEDALDD